MSKEEITKEQRVLDYVRTNGSISRAGCERLLGVTEVQARRILQKMVEQGQLRATGQYKNTRYVLR